MSINMKKDLNQIAKIEKAMSKKFGHESIVNPKSGWDDEKEEQYLQDLKTFYSEELKEAEDKWKHLTKANINIQKMITANIH